MWGIPLSGPLPIVAMVSRYLTIKLMGRMAISCRPKALTLSQCRERVLWGINPSFPGLFPCKRQVPYAVRTRAPVVSGVQALPVTPRLACVRPAASVHPEPGSNSSSLICKYSSNQQPIKSPRAHSLDSKFLFYYIRYPSEDKYPYAVSTIFQ